MADVAAHCGLELMKPGEAAYNGLDAGLAEEANGVWACSGVPRSGVCMPP